MFSRTHLSHLIVGAARSLTARQLLLAVTAALALAAPAAATRPQRQQFELTGQFTSPTTTVGRWAASGRVEGTGTYTETARLVGRAVVTHKVLTSTGGTITLDVRAVVVWLDECTARFRAGSWHISDATGAYEGLKGGGAPATTAESFANVCSGVIQITHRGRAHDD